MTDETLSLPMDGFTEESITLIPPGKLRCVVTGKLRNDTPEEHVRQRISRSLIEDYGYSKTDMELELTVNIGQRKTRADIAIFPPNSPHRQENAKIIVECKREEVRPSDRDNGVEQLKSYVAASLNARYGMWIGSELQVWEKLTAKDSTHELTEASDIPRFGADAPQPLTFAQLISAQEELIAVFKRCHNYIYGNQGLQKEPAFQELLKLIFCKVFDEDTSGGIMRFFISNEERRSEIGQRRLRSVIDQLFKEVRGRYPYIFGTDDQLRLDNRVLAYVVGELQRYSLLQTDTDVKGAAYEQLVGSNLRGDRGEFFTPRQVCEMTARMVFATYPRNRWASLRTIDPSCGTGGFLVAAMSVLREYIYEQEERKWGVGNEARAADDTRRLVKDAASKCLMGIDFNPILVRAAQMNLVMHGDGSTNVFHANSLLPPGEWPTKPPNDVANHIQPESFDVILTNPPFGSKIPIDDPHILEQFELARFEATGNQRRASMPPEQLFIERCMQLLRPGGRMGIVLPDSILSNSGLAFIRRWLLSKARLVASVDLPQVTFEPYTGTQTSVLILQKKTAQEIHFELEAGRPREHEVFMTTPQAVGHDRRGEILYLRTQEGELIEYEEEKLVHRRISATQSIVEMKRHKRKVVHDELPEVVRYFIKWLDESDRMRWING